MGASSCLLCARPDVASVNAVGLQAQAGDVSWREATRQLGLAHHAQLKNHIEKHVDDPNAEPDEADRLNDTLMEAMQDMVDKAIEELLVEAQAAPTTVKPLYLVAARNLAAVWATRPSQANLIAALKGISEITGMKQQQRMMMDFASAAIAAAYANQLAPVVPSGHLELPAADNAVGSDDIVDAEIVE